MPSVIFQSKDYYGVMAQHCWLTVVGKFLKTRPEIEIIQSSFAEKISIKGNIDIGAYDFRIVFMDFSNEEDCKNVFFKRVIEIDGQQILLEQWTPDFKPDEDSPFAPV